MSFSTSLQKLERTRPLLNGLPDWIIPFWVKHSGYEDVSELRSDHSFYLSLRILTLKVSLFGNFLRMKNLTTTILPTYALGLYKYLDQWKRLITWKYCNHFHLSINMSHCRLQHDNPVVLYSMVARKMCCLMPPSVYIFLSPMLTYHLVVPLPPLP